MKILYSTANLKNWKVSDGKICEYKIYTVYQIGH